MFALILVLVIFFWQLSHPVVLFIYPTLDTIAGLLLAIGLPWLAAVELWRLGRWWTKAVAILASIFLLIYSPLLLLFSAISADKLIAEHPWRSSQVRLYQTNGGATTDFGVLIQQERIIFPGIRLVRRVDSFYPCRSLEANAAATGVEIFDYQRACPTFPGGRRLYELKPMVYF